MRERPSYILGDIHGQRDKMVDLLAEARLMGGDGAWTGGSAVLVLMGDFSDHGPDGLGAVEVAMHLQEEALAAGGSLVVLLGNHEVLLLSAYIFGWWATPGPGGTFLTN